MRLIYIILMLSFVSCTTHRYKAKITPTESPLLETDKSLLPIIDSFKYEAMMHGVFIDITRVNMGFGLIREEGDITTVGYCLTTGSGTKIIRLHEESWRAMDLYEQEELVFHELGHCLLNRVLHCDNRINGDPISILNAYIPNGNYYKDNREVLLDELFNPNPECRPNGNADEVNREIRSPKIGHSKR